ncbi:MAG: hypothetical protein H6828_08935 [Planctomycetes bacterium]|nr:hypothetical protein [Planctomycetota bacterium]
MLLTFLLACAPGLPAASFATPQQDTPENPHRATVTYFAPQRADAHELLSAARDLCAIGMLTHIFQEGDDPAQAHEGRPDFLLYGESLLVVDSASGLPETLAMLEELDANYVGKRRGPAPEPPKSLLQYEVKHASLRTVTSALFDLYGGQVQPSPAGYGAPPKISVVEDNGLILVRGTAEQVVEAETILKQVDVPRPKVLLTVYVLRGTSTAQADDRVPADLTSDLSPLVPYKGFELLSSALLPSDTRSPIRTQASLENDLGEWGLTMKPAAYDERTGTLAFDGVDLEVNTIENGARTRRTLSTATSLRRGEYTVLGAVGANPVFCVVKLTAAQ